MMDQMADKAVISAGRELQKVQSFTSLLVDWPTQLFGKYISLGKWFSREISMQHPRVQRDHGVKCLKGDHDTSAIAVVKLSQRTSIVAPTSTFTDVLHAILVLVDAGDRGALVISRGHNR